MQLKRQSSLVIIYSSCSENWMIQHSEYGNVFFLFILLIFWPLENNPKAYDIATKHS